MEMVERVARATFHAECELHKHETGYKDLWDWLDVVPAVRERHMAIARAAIEVMREPTDAQLAAFTRSCDTQGQCLVKYGYTAMIDAALSTPPETDNEQQ